MKPMLITPSSTFPEGSDWVYECKYDGFRCLLDWNTEEPDLISRTGKKLNDQFPEIIQFCKDMYSTIKSHLPITLDSELVHLVSPYQSLFQQLQLRGRMRSLSSINQHVKYFPCQLVVFDIMIYNGETTTALPLTKRRKLLETFFSSVHLPLTVDDIGHQAIQLIDQHRDPHLLWSNIQNNYGEGIIAKKSASKWEAGKRTTEWQKIKNWRYINVFLTLYDKKNGYFHGAVYKNEEIVEIVVFRHGLSEEEEKTLVTFFKENGTKQATMLWKIPPSICVTIACIEFDGKALREPRFHSFNFSQEADECTWMKLMHSLYPITEQVEITHPEKPIWPIRDIKKNDYLLYLQTIAPYLLKFLRDRLLTVIRFPHGATSESFYQKNCPDYAPDFVKRFRDDEIDYILCNDVETLLWLGNQLALEFHIPFQPYYSQYPTEIVFDLDPPSRDEFSLAVEAAVRMKAIFDEFQLGSFIKTSGGKGLQVYIPLPEDTFSYTDTRIFTSFVCQFLCEQEPNWFTTERLKKKRNNKLYLDYIQHDAGKTIIAPYSPRGNHLGIVATPLEWSEVTDSLRPEQFTLESVIDRVKTKGDLFRLVHQKTQVDHPFKNVVTQLKELKKK